MSFSPDGAVMVTFVGMLYFYTVTAAIFLAMDASSRERADRTDLQDGRVCA